MSTAVETPTDIEIALLGYLRHRGLLASNLFEQVRSSVSLGVTRHLTRRQLYALLARLEDGGYVYVIANAQENGVRQSQQPLALTEAGRDAFEEWLEEPVAYGRKFRLRFLAKLSCAARESDRCASRLIARQSAACEYWLAGLRARIAALGEGAEKLCYDRLGLAFRADQIEAILAWLDHCDASLGAAST